MLEVVPFSTPCTREAGLTEKDAMIAMKKEAKMCCKKAHQPGYERLMNTRYGEGNATHQTRKQ